MTFLYETLLKPLFFRRDPEWVHEHVVKLGATLGRSAVARWLLSLLYEYEHPALVQEVAGLTFRNPVGLAAGFDKECQLMHVLPSIGFGFEEVGSITAEPYGGNPQPRLVRLPDDRSIIVYYGLKSSGARVLKRRLLDERRRRAFRIPIGVSVAKTNKHFRNDREKLDDWIRGIKALKDVGDYLTINVSCPNTYDPTNYCDPRLLEKLLFRIENEKLRFTKPLFLKLTADLTPRRLDEIIKVCRPRPWITGFILTNLVKERSKLQLKSPAEKLQHPGGLSGKPVKQRALALVRHAQRRAGDRFVLIGCGGIFTAEDAYEYLRAGASLVQLATGMIYRGPGTIKEINKGLVRLLARDGYASISELHAGKSRKAATHEPRREHRKKRRRE